MFGYCVEELGLSEDAAYRRITAARAARKFPVLFEHVASGRLHLTAVVLLASYLKDGDGEALIAESIGRTKAEIEQVLARRFGTIESPTRIRPLIAPVELPITQSDTGGIENPSQLAPERVDVPDALPPVTPSSSTQ